MSSQQTLSMMADMSSGWSGGAPKQFVAGGGSVPGPGPVSPRVGATPPAGEQHLPQTQEDVRQEPTEMEEAAMESRNWTAADQVLDSSGPAAVNEQQQTKRRKEYARPDQQAEGAGGSLEKRRRGAIQELRQAGLPEQQIAGMAVLAAEADNGGQQDQSAEGEEMMVDQDEETPPSLLVGVAPNDVLSQLSRPGEQPPEKLFDSTESSQMGSDESGLAGSSAEGGYKFPLDPIHTPGASRAGSPTPVEQERPPQEEMKEGEGMEVEAPPPATGAQPVEEDEVVVIKEERPADDDRRLQLEEEMDEEPVRYEFGCMLISVDQMTELARRYVPGCMAYMYNMRGPAEEVSVSRVDRATRVFVPEDSVSRPGPDDDEELARLERETQAKRGGPRFNSEENTPITSPQKWSSTSTPKDGGAGTSGGGGDGGVTPMLDALCETRQSDERELAASGPWSAVRPPGLKWTGYRQEQRGVSTNTDVTLYEQLPWREDGRGTPYVRDLLHLPERDGPQVDVQPLEMGSKDFELWRRPPCWAIACGVPDRLRDYEWYMCEQAAQDSGSELVTGGFQAMRILKVSMRMRNDGRFAVDAGRYVVPPPQGGAGGIGRLDQRQ